MNQEQAKFLAEFFATAIEQEGRTTAKVLAAVQGRQPRLQARSEGALGVGAGDASGDGRHVVSRQHLRRRLQLRP